MSEILSKKVKLVRRPNFTPEETKVLVDEYKRHAKALDGKFSNTITGSSKKIIWNRIMNKVNAVGGNNRTVLELTKKYTTMRSDAKRIEAGNRRSFKKTGGGSPEYTVLDEVQQTIVSTLSHSAIEGVDGGIDLYDDTSNPTAKLKLVGNNGSKGYVSDHEEENQIDVDDNFDLNSLHDEYVAGLNSQLESTGDQKTTENGNSKNVMAKTTSTNKDLLVMDSQLPSSSSGGAKKYQTKDKERKQISTLLYSTPSSTKGRAREDRISTPSLLKQQVKLLEKQVDLFEEIRDELRTGNEIKREMIEIERQKLELKKAKNNII